MRYAPWRAPAERIADDTPVHPGLVHLVDPAERERGCLRGLLRRQADCAAGPHHPVEIREFRDAPRLPVPEAGDGRPRARVLRLPRFAGGRAVASPPVLPQSAVALIRRALVARIDRQHVEAGVEAADRAQARVTNPRLDSRAGPRGAHESHGDVLRLVNLAAEEVAHCREPAQTVWNRTLPHRRLLECGSRLRRTRVRDRHQADLVVGRSGGDELASARLANAELHVRLTRAEKDVSDEDVRQRPAGAAVRADLERMRSPGGQGGQGCGPAARRVGACRDLGLGHQDRDLVTRSCGAPDRDRLVALEHGVILEEGTKGEGWLGLRRGGGEGEDKGGKEGESSLGVHVVSSRGPTGYCWDVDPAGRAPAGPARLRRVGNRDDNTGGRRVTCRRRAHFLPGSQSPTTAKAAI